MGEDRRLPWLRFYGGDWLGEEKLLEHGMRGLVLNGAWIRLVSAIASRSKPTGSIEVSTARLAGILNCDERLAVELLGELRDREIAEVEPLGNDRWRVTSRRVRREVRECESRAKEADRKRRTRKSGGSPAEVRRKSSDTRARVPEARSQNLLPPSVGEEGGGPPPSPPKGGCGPPRLDPGRRTIRDDRRGGVWAVEVPASGAIYHADGRLVAPDGKLLLGLSGPATAAEVLASARIELAWTPDPAPTTEGRKPPREPPRRKPREKQIEEARAWASNRGTKET